MTNVPFTASFLLTIWVFTSAVRKQSTTLMAIGGVLAAITILVRQFGVALIPALALTLFMGQTTSRSIGLYIAGLTSPILAATWQIHQGLTNPNWGALMARRQQTLFLNDPLNCILEAIWRPTAMMHFMAWFALPMVGVMILASFAWKRGRPIPSRTRWLDSPKAILLTFAVYLVAGVAGVKLLGHPWLMPLLPWQSGVIEFPGVWFQLLVTLLSLTGAVFFTMALIERFGLAFQRDLSGKQLFERVSALYVLDLASIISVLLSVVFFQFGDQYLLPYVPVVLIAACSRFKKAFDRFQSLLAISSIAVMVGSALWTWNIMVWNEAHWSLAENLVRQGIQPAEIGTERPIDSWCWRGFHDFDRYVATSGQRGIEVGISDYFRWNDSDGVDARYLIVHSNHWKESSVSQTIERRSIFSIKHGGWLDLVSVKLAPQNRQ